MIHTVAGRYRSHTVGCQLSAVPAAGLGREVASWNYWTVDTQLQLTTREGSGIVELLDSGYTAPVNY